MVVISLGILAKPRVFDILDSMCASSRAIGDPESGVTKHICIIAKQRLIAKDCKTRKRTNREICQSFGPARRAICCPDRALGELAFPVEQCLIAENCDIESIRCQFDGATGCAVRYPETIIPLCNQIR